MHDDIIRDTTRQYTIMYDKTSILYDEGRNDNIISYQTRYDYTI